MHNLGRMLWVSRPTGAAFAQSSCHAHSGRLFASAASHRPNPHFGPSVSLEHFLQRSKVMALWKRILRDTRRIDDPGNRRETRRLAKYEFERYKDVEDLTHIRYLLSTGKVQWDSMERYIDGI